MAPSTSYTRCHNHIVSNELITPAVQLVDGLYEEGQLYKKAGVMLGGIGRRCIHTG